MTAATATAPRARKAKAEPAPVTAASARKDLVRLLRENAYDHQLWSVWSDFVELAAINLASVDLAQRDVREARYLDIVKRYKPEQVARFAHAFGALTLALEEEPSDVLGSVFMELELGNKWKGQFFTPFSMCRLMAALQVDDDLRAKVASQGYVTANDPAVGGGAMLIAFAVEMAEAGIPYQDHLHVTAQDIDERAAHMAYVQLSLLGVPGVIVVGDTLRLETRSRWYTPMHVLGGWSQRLRGGWPLTELPRLIDAALALETPANESSEAPAAEPVAATTPPAAPDVQIALPWGDQAPAAAPRARKRRAA